MNSDVTVQNAAQCLACLHCFLASFTRRAYAGLISASSALRITLRFCPGYREFPTTYRSSASCKSFKVVYGPFFHGGNTLEVRGKTRVPRCERQGRYHPETSFQGPR